MSSKFNPIISAKDDGLIIPEIGPWSDVKYKLIGKYAAIFNSGMKNIIPNRIYVDLFSGAGYAKIKETNRIIYTSALIALSLSDPFTKYIFSEFDEEKMAALRARVKRHFPEKYDQVEFVTGDSNQNINEIKAHIPEFSPTNKVLTFCFVDPFSLNLHFNTIKSLGDKRIDFLILMALQMDGKRNLEKYLEENNSKINLFLDEQNWRQEFLKSGYSAKDFTKYLSYKYDSKMKQLGYLEPPEKHRIQAFSTHLPLYYLAFYSKHERGNEFWSKIKGYATNQSELF
jgi:three-Cys-motif partner protein